MHDGFILFIFPIFQSFGIWAGFGEDGEGDENLFLEFKVLFFTRPWSNCPMSALNKHELKESHIVQPSQNQCLWIVRPLWTKSYKQRVHLFFLNIWFFFRTYSHGYWVTVTAVGITHLPCEIQSLSASSIIPFHLILFRVFLFSSFILEGVQNLTWKIEPSVNAPGPSPKLHCDALVKSL